MQTGLWGMAVGVIRNNIPVTVLYHNLLSSLFCPASVAFSSILRLCPLVGYSAKLWEPMAWVQIQTGHTLNCVIWSKLPFNFSVPWFQHL